MKKLLPLLALVVLLGAACGERIKPADGLQMTEDNKLAQDYFEYIGHAVEAESDSMDGDWTGKTDTLNGSLACVTLTYDTVTQVKTIHFGLDSTGNYANCQCSDGLMRRGKIHLSFTGKFFDTGVVTTVTAEDLFVDDNEVEGTLTLVHQANNANGNPERTLKVTGAKITAPASEGGWEMSWYRDQTVEMIKGATTWWWPFDDIFIVTEDGGGVGRFGHSYTYSTTTPIVIRRNCLWLLVDGVVELKHEGKMIGELDLDPIGEYDATGEGQDCDVKFKITLANGKEHKFGY